MKYINDPTLPAKTYREVVDAAVGNGVDPGRVYIYLAGLGVKGELTRTLDGNTYSEPVKMAMKNETTFVTSVSICDHCEQLVVK